MKRVAPQRKRVVLLVETLFAYGRDLLDGIAEYQQMHSAWACWFRPWHREHPTDPTAWDGAIGRFENERQAAMFAGKPVVNVYASGKTPATVPSVLPDNRECGRRIARELFGRGFRNFAFVGLRDRWFVAERHAGFAEELETLGAPRPARYEYEAVLHHGEAEFCAWLETLPRPLGLMASHDVVGRAVLELVCSVGIDVPDELAVIGVDNDPQVCSLSFPHLSSLDPNGRTVGLHAAELLSKMMDDPAFEAPLLTVVPPLEIVRRRSSDVFAVDDAVARRALTLIRDHLGDPITVTDIASAAGVSRRALEMRFADALGTTPAAEIRNRRLQWALKLLITTRLDMSAIAEKVGIRNQSTLSILVKRLTGLSPREYRNKHTG